MVLDVNSATVSASAATEAAVSAGVAATTAAAAAALTGVLPMGADLDSAAFAAALNAAGATYVGTAADHLTSRGEFAGSQGIAAVTYTASDIVNNAALAL
jgi:hypothetical protein